MIRYAIIVLAIFAVTLCNAADISAKQRQVRKRSEGTLGSKKSKLIDLGDRTRTADPSPDDDAGPSKSKYGKPQLETRLSIVILTSADGLGVRSESLRSLFDRSKYNIQIRQETSQDRVEIREKVYHRLRTVNVIGRLEANDQLVFKDRKFALSDTKAINEWFRELETYGAQGAPEGKPLWGMTDEQFKEVHQALAEKVQTDVQGKKFEEALTALQLPADLPLRVSIEASSWLRRTFPRQPPVQHSLVGCAKGTALAIVTNEFGMGFRPLRTPDGGIELVVDPLTKSTDVWPVGWHPKEPENQVVPTLYKLDPVEFENQKLLDAFQAITRDSGVPIRIDYFGIKTQGIDLDTLVANLKRQKTPLSRVLTKIVNPSRLDSEIRIDEAGRPFVWISFLIPDKPVK